MTDTVATPILTAQEVETIYIKINARVRELLCGEHASLYFGPAGSDFADIRPWQPGDSPRSVDWAKSTQTLFNPLMVRDRVEDRSVDIIIAADASLSTRCGKNGVTIGHTVARAIATIGFSGVIFQDSIGFVAFDEDRYAAATPRGGKNQVYHILGLYRDAREKMKQERKAGLARLITNQLRRTSLIAVVSDFLFQGADAMVRELARLTPPHDLFLVMVEGGFAFDISDISSGWIGCSDVETGQTALLSRSELLGLPERARQFQDNVLQAAKKKGIEVVSVNSDPLRLTEALSDFFIHRANRLTANRQI